MENINKTQKSFGRKVLEAILGLSTPVLAVLSPGCVEGYTVTPELGVNIPTSQRFGYQCDSSISHGVRVGVRTKKGVEVEAEARFHNTEYNNGFQINALDATDLSMGVVIPLQANGKVEFYAVPRVINRGEKDSVELIGVGNVGSTSRSSTGFGVGVGARFQAGKGSVDARVMFEGFGKGSYEESGVRVDAGYTFSF